MKKSNEEYRRKLNDFLRVWSLENVKKMTLSQYVELNDKSTFCYWVEYETKELGTISLYADIYGIFKMKDKSKIPNKKRLKTDKIYKWKKEYGDDPEEAFNYVKSEIIKVIEYSIAGDFEKIDNIKLHPFWKWKIAYLYSKEKLSPFFKNNLLLFTAKELGGKFEENTKISVIQEFINKFRPKNETVYEFSNKIWDKYNALNIKARKYFIIGSKYGSTQDVFPLMQRNNIVCVGFAPDHSLSDLYGKKKDAIETALDNRLKSDPNKSDAKSTLLLLLQMKPGDMIAIKSSGRPIGHSGNLEIIGYAFVVNRENKVYFYDNKIGHCINIEFIETGITKRFNIGGYGKTLYDISGNEELIKTIFSEYISPLTNTVREKTKRRRRKESKLKNTGKQRRKGSKPYIANNKHNDIQNKFAKYLKDNYGEDNVKMEENYVDIKLKKNGEVILYEVKPYYWAEDCIRFGLGQILNYSFFNEDPEPKKLVILGPNPPDEEEKDIIKHIKSKLKIDFDYEYFSID